MLNKEFLLNREFVDLEGIEVPCPTCCKGLMRGNESTLLKKETKISTETKKEDKFDEWTPELIQENFAGILICDNCNESLSVSGTGGVCHVNYWDSSTKEYEDTYLNLYTPLFFHPSLKLIDVPLLCSKNINATFYQSFSLFWFDLDSCANKLRIALELLMDDKKVKKTQLTKKGKRQRLTLHSRINIFFAKTHPELAELLLAVKWIGNEGSHVGGLTREDLVNAYELIEHALTEIYDSKIARLQKISKTINKTKKPLSKTKKRE